MAEEENNFRESFICGVVEGELEMSLVSGDSKDYEDSCVIQINI